MSERRSSLLAPLLANPRATCILRNADRDRVLTRRVEPAFDRATRNRGLLGRTHLDRDHALILAPCSSVHTFFMKFAIDVVFVSREGRVLKIRHRMPAWRIAFRFFAFAVVELAAGVAAEAGTRIGDRLELLEPPVE